MRANLKAILFFLLPALLGLASPAILAADGERSADNVWTTISADELNETRAPNAVPWIRPDAFKAVALEPAVITAVLAAAPTVVTLPRPDGGFERFLVSKSSVMHPDLEKRMADEGWPMKTYSGESLDNPATTVALDWGGPAGFHALVRSPDGNYFVDPYWQGDQRLYSSYFERDHTLGGKGKPWQEIGYIDTTLKMPTSGSGETSSEGATRTTNGNLRTFRMAVAGTAGYTTFHSQPNAASAAAGQAAITTSIARLSGLYEKELSVRFQLVANNLNIVFTGAEGNYPFTTESCFDNNGIILDQNQTIIDTVIELANYDIGHVFGSTAAGGGGLAGAGVCVDDFFGNGPQKAQGCSSSSNPTGDGFDLELMAHEVGHQFSASHTFNGSDANCAGGNWGGTTNSYEPGSGSTIMAYGGICGVDNLGPPNKGYFHRRSLDQMLGYINTTANCAAQAAVNANEPVVNAGADYTIPSATPFELSGTGTDADADALTFTWEQFDQGTQSPLATGDDGTQPIFRSFPPSIAGNTRVFPRPGPAVLGETLPVTNRTMNFKLTARDNRAGGGREGDDAAAITSTTAAGPFLVTVPNGGETYAPGATPLVTWNPAGTAGAPVSTPFVDILLSHDGGLSYSESLLPNTGNDGSENVTIPATIASASARLKVKGAGNVFFDVSDNDFSVNAQCRTPALALADPGTVNDTLTITSANTITDLNLKLDITHSWVGDLTVVLEHVGTGKTVTLIDQIFQPANAQGCSDDNIVADIDDEGFAPIEDQCLFNDTVVPAVTGRLTPNNPLSAFDGDSFGGDWRLSITDIFGGDTGTLNRWCLDGYFGTPATGCPNTQMLSNQTLAGAQTYPASVSATLGPALIVNGTNIVVQAPTIIIGDGTTIGGTFKAVNANCT